MKLKIRVSLLCIMASHFLFTSISMAQTPVINIPIKLKPVIKTNALPIGLKLPPLDSLKKNVDPAAMSINFSVGKVVSSDKARITITGVVKNIGKDNYVSNAGQQVMLLYRTYPGGSPALIATQAFQNLAAGAETKISYSTDWSKSAEFPPKFTLVISYDPDLYGDGNYSNNDINTINNQVSREGSDINKLKW